MSQRRGQPAAQQRRAKNGRPQPQHNTNQGGRSFSKSSRFTQTVTEDTTHQGPVLEHLAADGAGAHEEVAQIRDLRQGRASERASGNPNQSSALYFRTRQRSRHQQATKRRSHSLSRAVANCRCERDCKPPPNSLRNGDGDGRPDRPDPRPRPDLLLESAAEDGDLVVVARLRGGVLLNHSQHIRAR